MKAKRWLELTHVLIPGQEEYLLEVENRYVEELLPEYRRPPEDWYILSEIKMWSHVGTHLEAPFHYLRDGADVAGIPLDRVIGEAVLLNFSDKGVGEAITRNDLEQRGQCIRQGDIVFILTGLSHQYRTPLSHDRPYLTPDAVEWLVEREIACLGVDCSGIEQRGLLRQPDHEMLFSHGIPLIEHLAHLEEIQVERFFVVAVPWRVKGLEASPVAVVALLEE